MVFMFCILKCALLPTVRVFGYFVCNYDKSKYFLFTLKKLNNYKLHLCFVVAVIPVILMQTYYGP